MSSGLFECGFVEISFTHSEKYVYQSYVIPKIEEYRNYQKLMNTLEIY